MKKTIKNIFGLIFITIMLLSVSVANADNDFGISLFSGTSSSDSNSIPGTSDLYYSFEDVFCLFMVLEKYRQIYQQHGQIQKRLSLTRMK